MKTGQIFTLNKVFEFKYFEFDPYEKYMRITCDEAVRLNIEILNEFKAQGYPKDFEVILNKLSNILVQQIILITSAKTSLKKVKSSKYKGKFEVFTRDGIIKDVLE
jgi:hypothetical protein